MRYFVIADDGSRFGPADVATLNQWIQEGRLLPTTLLEAEESGARVVASAVPGIAFPMAAPAAGPYQNPPQPQQFYPRGNPMMYGDDGSKELKSAWTYGVLALLCCAPLSIAGIINANKAKAKGNPNATGALVLNWIAVGIWILFIIVRVIAFSH